MVANRDYYQLLDVSVTASREQIKQAFRRQARLHHPDLHPNDPGAAEKFRQLRQAYEVLVDPRKRQAYDRELGMADTGHTTFRRAGDQAAAATPQVAYVRGVEKLQQQEYLAALEEFGRAIALDPLFGKAYLKRCEVLLHLGRDRDILEDCQRLLKLQPENADAYYYRGRARQNLGYTQAAVQAYTQALYFNGERRDLYYHRGNAYNECGDRRSALRDWQTYAELCQKSNDDRGYRAAMAAIARQGWQPTDLVGSAWRTVAALGDHLDAYSRSAGRILGDPVGGMLPAYVRVGGQRAALAGCVYAAATAGIAQASLAWGWLPSILAFDGWPWFGLGLVPFTCLIGIGVMTSYFSDRRRINLDTNAFIAGAALLPLGVFALCWRALLWLGDWQLFFGTLAFVVSWLVLILFSSYTKLLKLEDRFAAFAVPGAIAATAWVTYGLALATQL